MCGWAGFVWVWWRPPFGQFFLVMENIFIEGLHLVEEGTWGTWFVRQCWVGCVSVGCTLDLLPLFLTCDWLAISCESKFFCLAVCRAALSSLYIESVKYSLGKTHRED